MPIFFFLRVITWYAQLTRNSENWCRDTWQKCRKKFTTYGWHHDMSKTCLRLSQLKYDVLCPEESSNGFMQLFGSLFNFSTCMHVITHQNDLRLIMKRINKTFCCYWRMNHILWKKTIRQNPGRPNNCGGLMLSTSHATSANSIH